MSESETTFNGDWAILELMGHRRLGGRITEVVVAGSPMLRIDVPETKTANTFTQFYGGTSVYCITPTTEEIARGVAEYTQAEPVQRWEIKSLPAHVQAAIGDDNDEIDVEERGETW